MRDLEIDVSQFSDDKKACRTVLMKASFMIAYKF